LVGSLVRHERRTVTDMRRREGCRFSEIRRSTTSWLAYLDELLHRKELHMAASPYDRLEDLLYGNLSNLIKSQDEMIKSHPAVATTTVLTIRSSRLGRIGSIVTTVDRELRRTAVILGYDDVRRTPSLGAPGARPRPLPANRGGLRVTGAGSGSLHLIVEAYGALVSMLTSQPVTAFVALLTLTQGTGSIRTWLGRKPRELERVTAQEEASLIRDLDGDTSRLMGHHIPDSELDIRPAADERLLAVNRDAEVVQGVQDISEASLVIGEVEAKGRRITYIHHRADGSRDIIYIES
jgi:hypothetical protein